MILLDLIGAGNSKFYNWFPQQSGPAFERMKNIGTYSTYARQMIQNQYYKNILTKLSFISIAHCDSCGVTKRD